jgi:hypothetical protein
MKRLITLLFLLFLVVPAWAQPKTDDGWEKVDGNMMAPGETIPASRLLGAAYGFIFAALVVWVASVASRTRRVEEEMQSLKDTLSAKR